MRLESAAHTAFTTPELALLLFAWCSPHDLTQCIRVCKQWLHLAEPVLWRNFCHGPQRLAKLVPETSAALTRNLPHIQTVELTVEEHALLHELAQGTTSTSQAGDAAVESCAPCTHLSRLTVKNSDMLLKKDVGLYGINTVRDFSFVLPTLVTLLNHNIRLTHLTFPFPDVETDDPVFAAISNLKGLRHLAVNSNGSSSVSSWTLSLLLRACLPLPNLTELCIKPCVYWVNKACGKVVPSLEAILKEAAIARFTQTPIPGKIKALQLPLSAESRTRPMALAFLKSDLLDLESFTVPPFYDDSNPGDVEQLVQERYPNLKHLRCTSHKVTLDGYRNMRAFIRGCSGLRSFASDGFEDQIYQGGNGSYESRCIISDLVSHHCDTLEDFELKKCDQVSSSDLQELLSRCRQLKRFRVSGNFPETRDWRYQDGDAGYDTEDASKGAWACTELRELWITLGRTSFLTENLFFRQIGRLERLEQLTLDIHRRTKVMAGERRDEDEDCKSYMDHELSGNLLGEMAGLKNLKSLRLAAKFCRRMSQAEIEFIHEHWPLLREITVMGSKGLELRIKTHWQWLFKKRPQLRFIVLDDDQLIETMRYL
ncbi:hypothetical protein BGZ72_011139 [Mortierella alpina]|nr:hypothetical protein BGZ72_011139 [Mortierella alpina]